MKPKIQPINRRTKIGYNIFMINKIWNFLKGLFIILYLLGIFYLVLKNDYISSIDNFSIWFIPSIAFISILYIGIYYLNMSLNKKKLEYEFTSIVNHTFRTPITSITWFIKELEKDLPQQEKLLYLQNIQNSINKILSIVDVFAGIKDVNNVSTYFFEAVSLREVVEKSIAKYRERINKKNITFKVSTFKDIPLLTVDLKKITFVVDTLIENAVFYTPSNSKILIDCISTRKSLTFFVSDTGLGLNFIDKMRIFSRFYRSKDARRINTDGMGLGLYLSKQIIKRHKGKIYAKSKGKNRGTTFFVKIPFK
jgi:signal transduction histidine kinase